MPILRGALIVLEGCDRSGKSTQCKNLVEWLLQAGKKAKYINFPDRGTDCGSLIDKFLTNKQEFADETIHLLFSLNRWETKTKMENLLMDGTTLVVDRYSYSGVAYSAAKGLSYDWCKAPEAGLLKPDLVFYLTLSPEKIAKRGDFGNERYEKLEFQREVLSCFDKRYDSSYWQKVDADREESDLTIVLAQYVEETMQSLANRPLKYLWTEKALNYKIEIPFLYPSTIYKLTKLRREEKMAQDLLDEFRHNIMKKRRVIMNASESCNNNHLKDGGRMVLVDHIIRNEENFTSKEILDHVLTFIGGYETISNAVAHVMLLLAINREFQDKLYNAIRESISCDDDINNSAIVNGIEYLELVLRESYRLMPTVPMILREVTDDFEVEPDLVIPKGVHLVVNIYALHRQINIWGSDANEFKPERFAADKADSRHIFSFLPFSGGSRICIANKYSNIAIKVTIIKLLRKFSFRSTTKMDDIKLKSYVSLKLCTEHLISLERRGA